MASHAAELAVQMATQRAMRAERRSAVDGTAATDRLRTDRELPAAVWVRSRSPRWLAAAGPDELVTVWASARPWAPHDHRAARAVETVSQRLAELQVDVDHATTALDRHDPADLDRLLGPTPEPTRTGTQISSADREKRVLEMLRNEWTSGTVEVVVAGDAFGALAYKLGWLEDQGHDMAAVVRSLPEARIVAPEIRQPAAYAAWLVDRFAADGEPVHLATEGIREPAEEAVARTAGRRPATSTKQASTSSSPRGRPDQR